MRQLPAIPRLVWWWDWNSQPVSLTPGEGHLYFVLATIAPAQWRHLQTPASLDVFFTGLFALVCVSTALCISNYWCAQVWVLLLSLYPLPLTNSFLDLLIWIRFGIFRLAFKAHQSLATQHLSQLTSLFCSQIACAQLGPQFHSLTPFSLPETPSPLPTFLVQGLFLWEAIPFWLLLLLNLQAICHWLGR